MKNANYRQAVAVVICTAALTAVWHPGVAHAQDAPKLPEPQYLGTVYWFDAAGAKLSTLDRARLVVAAKMKAFGYGGVKGTLQAPGQKAAVRFTADQKLEFVFQAQLNVDPQTIAEIVAFDMKKDHRELVSMESNGPFGGVKAGERRGEVPFQAAKYSESSIKISPTDPLKPGEYAVRIQSSPEVFCFGVDAR
jgi:hypothetical protein